MQLYLKQVLEAFFHSQSSVRHFALNVIALTLNQGLIHPVQVRWLDVNDYILEVSQVALIWILMGLSVQCVPYLIAMGTDPEPSMRNKADQQLVEIDKKYTGFIHVSLNIIWLDCLMWFILFFIIRKHLPVPVGNGFISPLYSFADEGGCWDENVVQFAAGHQFVSKDHHKRFPSGWDPFSPLFPPLHYDQGEPAAPEGFPHLTTEPFWWQFCKSKLTLFLIFMVVPSAANQSLF